MVCLFVGLTTRASIPEETIQTTVTAIQAKGGTDKQLVEAGVRQVARLWQSDDGEILTISNLFVSKITLRTP